MFNNFTFTEGSVRISGSSGQPVEIRLHGFILDDDDLPLPSEIAPCASPGTGRDGARQFRGLSPGNSSNFSGSPRKYVESREVGFRLLTGGQNEKGEYEK